jgi:hypothetical protein
MILSLLAASVIGCDVPGDGYEFKAKEYENKNPNIVFVVHKTFKELHESAKEHGVQNYKVTRAFSILKPDSCMVHILDPSTHYYPEYIGHEITHCMYGRWHH